MRREGKRGEEKVKRHCIMRVSVGLLLSTGTVKTGVFTSFTQA